MKKIEAYQISDGRKFFKKEEAQRHEERLRYKAQVEKVEIYLYDLLGIEDKDPAEDGEGPEEQLSDMLMGKGISGVLEDARDQGEIVELIIDIATIFDGALLKTAQYAKVISSK